MLENFLTVKTVYIFNYIVVSVGINVFHANYLSIYLFNRLFIYIFLAYI